MTSRQLDRKQDGENIGREIRDLGAKSAPANPISAAE
jgi:hypothetical protein